MINWQNGAGIMLALFVLAWTLSKGVRRESWFAFTMVAFYAMAIFANWVAFKNFKVELTLFTSEYVINMPRAKIVEAVAFVHLMGFLFVPLLILSCIHLADNNCQRHKARFAYIILTGFKSAFGTSYAASLFNDNAHLAISQAVEYYWFIPDMLVLLAGTSNPLSDRWQTK